MFTIERATNGFILRNEDNEATLFQSEYGSINHALAALMTHLNKEFASELDIFQVAIQINNVMLNAKTSVTKQ